MRSAIQTFHIVSALVDQKSAKKLKPEDFILRFEQKQPKKQTWQEQLAMMKSFTAALSGKEGENKIKK